MRRAFTMLEIICAVSLLGVVTAVAVAVSSSITRGWEASADYADKMQRSDYALGQVVSAMRSMYYPRSGQQSYDYGFILDDRGDGATPDDSDVVEWSRLASVGSREKAASTVHRVQIMMLEGGDTTYGKTPVEKTGLYMRRRPDVQLAPKGDMDEKYGFDNEKLYEPTLVADGVVGFNCRVMKEPQQGGGVKADNDRKLFEDRWDNSNAVPYKVELTFMLEDPERPGATSDAAPVVRIIRIPVYEQGQDGAKPPSDEESGGGRRKGR